MNEDPTMNPLAAYGSDRWCAITLGRGLEWFRKRRDQLEVAGFPAKDPITGLTMKADVNAWLARRRRIADAETSRHKAHKPPSGANFDAF
ncbi:hypothetical protein [Halodurantibacterium flavum]|uniref:Uncharacterized protein n=1 Tax=Halodurantibacterium flavum TaxID=1382802 RepID=A0ABW4S8G1_9RHOB